MNAHSKIEQETLVNMTSKGQVLIPKALRDRAGLKAGQPVRVGTNDRGETVILPVDASQPETPEQRRDRVLAAIDAIAGKYPTPNGMSTDEYMRDLRGDWEP
ncbi:AbrB/MazE/SpoVT family DNA-binding domain-containing protein [Novosphingobium sp.]|uniref:AbrB/MazE/SpoVT family DNA-binding domain-containing protein n=1 Tax=Novosphingobium sp. TaxID=1874826 RepID=UPI00260370B5|nr:AbrB/MazE/SpoVT family DNA-binding domain-containing protein [Novosphingobium sp.]